MRRGRALRRRYGHAVVGAPMFGASETPWAGTSFIDRRYYDIQPGLALVALGSEPIDARAEAMIAKGQEFLAWLEPQRAPRVVRAYKEDKLGSIRRLVTMAEARRG